MKNDEYPPQSGAGGAEPLQNKENCCGKSCGSGAEELESGAGTPNQDEAAMLQPTTTVSKAIALKAKVVVAKGAIVRFKCLGSTRDGLTATVRYVKADGECGIG